MRSDASRAALLDAAERLFAEHGVSGASDRKVAEAAGQRNHSAVAYYFGGRDGLLGALVERHMASLEGERQKYLDLSTSLLGDVRSLVLPMTESLRALPVPSWRAQFLARAIQHPDARPLLREGLDSTPVATQIGRSIAERLGHLDRGIVRGRISLMMRVVVMTCADVERSWVEGRGAPRWEATGVFLSDALAGMLAAPSSLVDGSPLGGATEATQDR